MPKSRSISTDNRSKKKQDLNRTQNSQTMSVQNTQISCSSAPMGSPYFSGQSRQNSVQNETSDMKRKLDTNKDNQSQQNAKRRSTLPPFAVKCVETSRKLGMPIREYITSGKAFEDFENEKKTKKKPVADRAVARAVDQISTGQTVTSERIIGTSATKARRERDITTHLYPSLRSSMVSSRASRGTSLKFRSPTPSIDTPKASSRASRGTAFKGRSPTPSIDTPETPPSTPGHSSYASSAVSTPKLTSSPQPVVLYNVTGKVTFATPADYARYTSDRAVLENAEQRKREKKAKKKEKAKEEQRSGR